MSTLHINNTQRFDHTVLSNCMVILEVTICSACDLYGITLKLLTCMLIFKSNKLTEAKRCIFVRMNSPKHVVKYNFYLIFWNYNIWSFFLISGLLNAFGLFNVLIKYWLHAIAVSFLKYYTLLGTFLCSVCKQSVLFFSNYITRLDDIWLIKRWNLVSCRPVHK